VQQPDLSTTEITLRGGLSRFDKPCPMRVIAPFWDVSSAGKVVPFGIGAQRTVDALLLDEPERLFLCGDFPLANLATVADEGAPLDPNATPPQYTPAFGGAGFQLQTLTVGKCTWDGSSVGNQYVTPGAEDVLAGIGAFTTWSGGVPAGWSKPTTPPSVVANGSIAQTSSYGSASAVLITSQVPMISPTYFGYWIKTAAVLLPDRAYRFTINLERVLGATDQIYKYGFAMLTKLTKDAKYWITPFLEPLTDTSGFTGQTYTFVKRMPAFETTLPIYLAAMSSTNPGHNPPTTASTVAVIDNLKVQMIPEFQSAPMDDATLKAAFTAILVDHAGEDASVFSAADCDAIDAAAGHGCNMRWEEQPNILDQLMLVADQFGAVIFEDPDDVIRVRELTVPESGDLVVAFSDANIDSSTYREWDDDAPGLTTLFGARHNYSTFGDDSEFVTDRDVVSKSVMERLKRPSQFLFSSDVRPANHYAAAIGAPRFHFQIDDPDGAKLRANRIVSLYPVKRKLCQFMVRYDGRSLGIGPTIDPFWLFFNDAMSVTIKGRHSARHMKCVGTQPYATADKIIVTGWF
jgi:hypothetical protein